ncbi:unnamed protein product [Aphanomyces euteiches]|uniref:Nas2 N-terminal domain-containing protein n=1 Tax=Aphanomyces euteiches TaxID=100861 RepID=A0A6G0XMV9_9STRA|nr:hypothetical protein Ae201684_003390 [Aphanomyces euteiches]KAH9152467.1 hypothetical protein AeRB84_005107 [Aphanomyces euteiches]
MERFKQLDKERAAIEAEIELIVEELNSGPNPIGLKGPLVDAEGFPRADIDVYNVRHKRHRFACLQTDLKWKMKEIEEVMAEIYGEKKAQQPPPPPKPAFTAPSSQVAEPTSNFHAPVKLDKSSEIKSSPFAKVESVQDGSPSFEAGLLVGDQIITFGSANADNHRELSAIREIVMRHINATIEVVAQRGEDQLQIFLVPHLWPGQGVLGCHIVPLHV